MGTPKIQPDKVRPYGDYVLVKAQEAEKTSKGGIIIPGTAQRQSGCQGEVMAVGPKVDDLLRGDLVTYESMTSDGCAPRLEGEDGTHYYFIRHKNITAVVDSEVP
jgi:chaperonin GroES